MDYQIRTLSVSDWQKLLNEWGRDYDLSIEGSIDTASELTLIVKRTRKSG